MVKINYALVLILLAFSLFVNFSNSEKMCKYHIKESGYEHATNNVGDCKHEFKGFVLSSLPFAFMFAAVALVKKHRKFQALYLLIIISAISGSIIVDATASFDPYHGGQIVGFLARAMVGILMAVISLLVFSVTEIKSKLSATKVINRQ